MLGLVFTELMQFIEDRHGEETVDAVLDALALEHDGAYTAVGNYPHTEAVAFLSEVSAQRGEPLPEMIEAFGHHLFGRFNTLYPEFFEGVETSMDFMERVEDHIHTEVKKLYDHSRRGLGHPSGTPRAKAVAYRRSPWPPQPADKNAAP